MIFYNNYNNNRTCTAPVSTKKLQWRGGQD